MERSYDGSVVLHVASQGGPHILLVALLVVAGGLAGFFAVSAGQTGAVVLGLSRDNALALAGGLVSGIAFVALLLI